MNKGVKEKIYNLFIALAVGFSSSLLFYLSFLQRNFFSKTYIGIAGLIFILISSGIYYCFPLLYKKSHTILGQNAIKLLIPASLVISVLLLGNFKIQPFYALLPETNLTLTIQPSSTAGQKESIRMLSLSNPLGYIHFSELKMDGIWQQDGKNILISPTSAFTLNWKGQAGDLVDIAFKPTSYEQKINIFINNKSFQFDLFQTSKELDSTFNQEISVPLVPRIPFIISFLITFSFLFYIFFLSQSLINVQPTSQKAGKDMWYFSAIPLTVACLFTLLIYWPGVMTNDSINQWQQALTGNFVDWHPVMHTLLIALLMRIWYSPAAVVLFQIALLALVFMFGIRVLEKTGVPRLVLWVFSLVFALWPLTSQMTVFLWKDVLFAVALFGFFIILLTIALTRGVWLQKNWSILALAGFFTAVFRQNGPAVTLIILGLLPFTYKSFRKQLIYAFLVFAALWLVVKFPITNFLTSKNQINQSQLSIVLLPHIAAHIENGTPLKPEEEIYLGSLMPLDKWDYQCCYIGNISSNENFARQEYLNNFLTNQKLTLSLFLRDPMVDIKHQLCSGEMVWRFTGNQCRIKPVVGSYSINPDDYNWIASNSLGLKKDPRLPGLFSSYIQFQRLAGLKSDTLIPFYRPALYSLIAIIIIVATSIRLRNYFILTTLLVLMSQMAILFAINIAPNFRYQFANCLIGIFSIALLFIPMKSGSIKKSER